MIVDGKDVITPCEGHGDLFFPGAGVNQTVRAAELEARFCGRCRVRAECLDQALTRGETQGIWAGKTWRELRKIRHRVSP